VIFVMFYVRSITIVDKHNACLYKNKINFLILNLAIIVSYVVGTIFSQQSYSTSSLVSTRMDDHFRVVYHLSTYVTSQLGQFSLGPVLCHCCWVTRRVLDL